MLRLLLVVAVLLVFSPAQPASLPVPHGPPSKLPQKRRRSSWPYWLPRSPQGSRACFRTGPTLFICLWKQLPWDSNNSGPASLVSTVTTRPTLAFSSSVLHGRHHNRGLAEVLQTNDQLGETHTGGRVQLVIGERVAFEGLDGNHQQVGRKGQPEGPLLPQSPQTMTQSHRGLTCGSSPAQDAHRRGVCEGGNPRCCLPSPEPWLHRP